MRVREEDSTMDDSQTPPLTPSLTNTQTVDEEADVVEAIALRASVDDAADSSLKQQSSQEEASSQEDEYGFDDSDQDENGDKDEADDESASSEAKKSDDEAPEIALTVEESKAIQTLSNAFQQVAKNCAFAFSGLIPCDEDSIGTGGRHLYYQTKKDKASRVTFPLDWRDADNIYRAGQASGFGRDGESVHDPEYRKAREIRPPHFSLSVDFLAATSMLALLGKRLDIEKPLIARINKLNIYPKGGFFKTHQESVWFTPQGEHHIGTLHLCLPSEFAGGEIVITQAQGAVTWDFASQLTTSDGKMTVPWGFLYADCSHEVLPVTDGHRLTVSYDIFVDDSEDRQSGLIDTRQCALRSALAAFPFEADGNRQWDALAFPLQHGYPLAYGNGTSRREGHDLETQYCKTLQFRLKGPDRVLLHVINELGLKWEFKAIFDCAKDDRRRPSEKLKKSTSADGDLGAKKGFKMTADVVARASREMNKAFLIHEDPFLLQNDWGHAVDQYTYTNLLDIGARKEGVIWASPPQSSAFQTRTATVTYGNEPQIEYVYVAMAIFVTYPGAISRGKGKRKVRKYF